MSSLIFSEQKIIFLKMLPATFCIADLRIKTFLPVTTQIQCQATVYKANSFDTEAPFLDLNLCISNGTVSTKIYDKRDDFDFDIVSFPFLDGDVPRRTSYGVYISQLIRFARASSNLNDLNYRNKPLLPNFLGRAIVILNFVRRFRNFIADTVPC